MTARLDPIVGRLFKPRAGFEPAPGRLEIGQQVENLPHRKELSERFHNYDHEFATRRPPLIAGYVTVIPNVGTENRSGTRFGVPVTIQQQTGGTLTPWMSEFRM